MAVPKKKTSRSKRDFRRYIWKKKVNKAVRTALSLTKALILERTSS